VNWPLTGEATGCQQQPQFSNREAHVVGRDDIADDVLRTLIPSDSLLSGAQNRVAYSGINFVGGNTLVYWLLVLFAFVHRHIAVKRAAGRINRFSHVGFLTLQNPVHNAPGSPMAISEPGDHLLSTGVPHYTAAGGLPFLIDRFTMCQGMALKRAGAQGSIVMNGTTYANVTARTALGWRKILDCPSVECIVMSPYL